MTEQPIGLTGPPNLADAIPHLFGYQKSVIAIWLPAVVIPASPVSRLPRLVTA